MTRYFRGVFIHEYLNNSSFMFQKHWTEFKNLLLLIYLKKILWSLSAFKTSKLRWWQCWVSNLFTNLTILTRKLSSNIKNWALQQQNKFSFPARTTKIFCFSSFSNQFLTRLEYYIMLKIMISPLKTNDFAIMIVYNREKDEKSTFISYFCGIFYYISFEFVWSRSGRPWQTDRKFVFFYFLFSFSSMLSTLRSVYVIYSNVNIINM